MAFLAILLFSIQYCQCHIALREAIANMVDLKGPNVTAQENRQLAVAEAPDFEKVDWKKDKGLRKLYINCCFGLLVASATTGYDG